MISPQGRRPIILDLDGSVLPLPEAHVLHLQSRQERLRFACRWKDLQQLQQTLRGALPARYGTALLGSGDFHHLSLALIALTKSPRPFQVVVLDNHPDNMRFPFGVHCGSWVNAACRLAQVTHVHVLGITSSDIGWRHAWENYWGPLRSGRLTYWSTGVNTHWANRVGLRQGFRAFDSIDLLVEAFTQQQWQQPQATYLSIDKDVFSPAVAQTNWDQGCMQREQAEQLIQSLATGGLVGSDITGEISQYSYRSRCKRWLAALDHQPVIDSAQLPRWQAQHQCLNEQLLECIARLPAAR